MPCGAERLCHQIYARPADHNSLPAATRRTGIHHCMYIIIYTYTNAEHNVLV